jgi:hypothetical protein
MPLGMAKSNPSVRWILFLQGISRHGRSSDPRVTAGVQLAELEGKAGAVISIDDRNQQQAQLAATAPNLDFKVESRKVTLDYQILSDTKGAVVREAAPPKQ